MWVLVMLDDRYRLTIVCVLVRVCCCEILRRIHNHRGNRAHGATYGTVRLLLRLPLPCLDSLLLHGHGTCHLMQVKVQATRVAHGVAAGIAPPQGGRLRLTVTTAQVLTPSGRHSLLGARLGPVCAI